MFFLVVTWGISLVSLSALYRLLQNFNHLYFSVEIKAFYAEVCFQEESLAIEAITIERR